MKSVSKHQSKLKTQLQSINVHGLEMVRWFSTGGLGVLSHDETLEPLRPAGLRSVLVLGSR